MTVERGFSHISTNRMMRIIPTILGLLALAPLTALAEGPAVTPEQAKFFEMKVRPLISQNCASCHGQAKQKGGLRLDSVKGLQTGGKDGAVVVPGDVDKSKLIEAVSYHNKELQMPPDGPLPPDQVEVLKAWVKMGAPWPDSVAITTPKKQRMITEENRAFWS